MKSRQTARRLRCCRIHYVCVVSGSDIPKPTGDVEHVLRKPCPGRLGPAAGPGGTPSAGRDLGFRIRTLLAEPRLPLSRPGAPPGPGREEGLYSDHITAPAVQGRSPRSAERAISFLSRCRHQPLCTVTSRTRSASPPTRSSQGPWATLLPHPRALPEGSAACLSPQASSSYPGSALAPQLGLISFNQWTVEGGMARELGRRV